MEFTELKRFFPDLPEDIAKLQEIRVRAARPVRYLAEGKETESRAMADPAMIRGLLELFSHHSLYAFEEELRQGFLTVEGGHRVGLSGKAVIEAGTFGRELRTLKEISSLNIRIAHSWPGCADGVAPFLYGPAGTIYNTLLIAPPGAGKTTMERELIRLLSEGSRGFSGVSVSVVDERSEIGACHKGRPRWDLGSRTDVMDGCPKALGMLMMLRSMGPQVLAVDEVGTKEDLEALKYVAACGCGLLATVHGTSFKDLLHKPVIEEMVRERLFERYVVLSKVPKPGTVVGVFDGAGELLKEGSGEDTFWGAAV